MYDFTFHRPATLDEAVSLMAENEDAKLMSGGMTLVPTMKQRLASPSDVVDLTGLKNTGIEVGEGDVVIKAGTCHADVASNGDLQKAIPALADLAGHIGDPHVRNRGTLGGSIANNDPAADYPAALLALDAEVTTTRRSVAAEDFFTGLFETALEPDEIVVSVRFKVPLRASYQKFSNPASRYAIAGVFVAEHSDGNVRVAITGAGPGVFRHFELESALKSDFGPGSVDGIEIDASELNTDMHASAEYRANLITVLARRAVAAMN